MGDIFRTKEIQVELGCWKKRGRWTTLGRVATFPVNGQELREIEVMTKFFFKGNIMVYFFLGNDPLKEGGNGEAGVEIITGTKSWEEDGNGIQCKVEGLSLKQTKGKYRGQWLCLGHFAERSIRLLLYGLESSAENRKQRGNVEVWNREESVKPSSRWMGKSRGWNWQDRGPLKGFATWEYLQMVKSAQILMSWISSDIFS